MKKKLAACITISLVMCLTMAFPASAAQYIPGIHNSLQTQFNNVYAQAVSEGLDSSYKYYAVFTNYNGSYIDTVNYSANEIIKSGDAVRHQDASNYYLRGPNLFSELYKYSSGYMYYRYTGISGTGGGGTSTYAYCPDLSTARFDIDFYSLGLSYDPVFLTLEPINTSFLESLLSQAKAIQEDGYRKSTYHNLQYAISSAENLLRAC